MEVCEGAVGTRRCGWCEVLSTHNHGQEPLAPVATAYKSCKFFVMDFFIAF